MRVLPALLLAVVLGSVRAEAQDEPETRAEASRVARDEKQQTLETYEPNLVERAMDFAEERAIFLLDREGFYPKLGSLATGSGFAYGVGFRDRDLFGYRAAVDVWAASSIRRYWALEGRVRLLETAGTRLRAEAWAGRRDYPTEAFFGLGPDSRRSDETRFALRTTHAGGRAGIRLAPSVTVGGSLEYLQPRAGRARGGDFDEPNAGDGDEDDRSIEELFDGTEAPGLGVPTNFLQSTVFVDVDYREPRNARQGGRYRAELSHVSDRTADRFTFDRATVDLQQFFGFLAGRRVIAARLHASSATASDGREVPFYLMPTLGGNDTLRGFRDYRFRGPHALLAQLEYRWEVWSALDAALFYDTGTVAERRSDLDLSHLERAYGFGFRFNTDNGVVFRVDAGFGSRDGKHLYIVFGGNF